MSSVETLTSSVAVTESEGAIAPAVLAKHNPVTPLPAVSSPSQTLTLDWLFGPKVSAPSSRVPLDLVSPGEVTERVLARLVQSETHEVNPHLRDDIRIAWLIVRHCELGDAVLCSPQVLATYEVLGCHPDQVWKRILARRQAMLGPAGARTALSQSAPVPKKPSHSIPAPVQREEA